MRDWGNEGLSSSLRTLRPCLPRTCDVELACDKEHLVQQGGMAAVLDLESLRRPHSPGCLLPAAASTANIADVAALLVSE